MDNTTVTTAPPSSFQRPEDIFFLNNPIIRAIIVVVGTVVGTVILAFAARMIYKLVRDRRELKAPISLTQGVPVSERRDNTYERRREEQCIANPGADVSAETIVLEELDPDLRTKVQRCLLQKNDLDIYMEEVLGKGQFGRVYKGLLRNGNDTQAVAVKTIRAYQTELVDVEGFLQEATIMTEFKHRNVLRLLGVCIDEHKAVYVVLPFMANGDLKTYLNKHKDTDIQKLLQFALDICTGMAYLESQKFVHRDLACRNCMVNDCHTVLIADFGLSRDIYEREYYRARDSHRPMPLRWLAPESITDGIYSSASDVWAYGIVLWEIVTHGAKPYPGVGSSDVLEYVQTGYRMQRPSCCPKTLYDIMTSCWAEIPETRPRFEKLLACVSDVDLTATPVSPSTDSPTNLQHSLSVESETGYMDMGNTYKERPHLVLPAANIPTMEKNAAYNAVSVPSPSQAPHNTSVTANSHEVVTKRDSYLAPTPSPESPALVLSKAPSPIRPRSERDTYVKHAPATPDLAHPNKPGDGGENTKPAYLTVLATEHVHSQIYNTKM